MPNILTLKVDYEIFYGKKIHHYFYNEANGRLKIMNAVNGGNFEFGYMENTSLQNRITYPNGMVKNTSFEEKRNLITGINYQNGANLISNYTYENDVLGRRNNIGITYDNTTKSNDYNYNPRSEVIGAHGDTLNQAFDYDNIGNRITSSNNDITTNYSTNNLNQYETAGDFVPLFDEDGNQTKIKTSKGEFLVEYNGENRPIKFTNLSDSTFITMKYDYMGRRGGKLHFNSHGTWTSTVKFFYKDYTLIEESTASNDVLKEFVWDPTAGQATKPLYMRVPQTGSNLLYLHDANKNVTEGPYLATANGIGAHYEYDTFGNIISSASSIENPFQFSSEYHDSELDLIYYNYRHYNPTSGRWISMDPIAEKGGYNLYNFTKNNVINMVDLLGEKVVDQYKIDVFSVFKLLDPAYMAILTGGSTPNRFYDIDIDIEYLCNGCFIESYSNPVVKEKSVPGRQISALDSKFIDFSYYFSVTSVTPYCNNGKTCRVDFEYTIAFYGYDAGKDLYYEDDFYHGRLEEWFREEFKNLSHSYKNINNKKVTISCAREKNR